MAAKMLLLACKKRTSSPRFLKKLNSSLGKLRKRKKNLSPPHRADLPIAFPQNPRASEIRGSLLCDEKRGATLTSVRKLIVNADDFGMTRGINRAIAEAHDAGIVTSTTLMANSEAFDDAVEIAARRPSLRVGCHVVLVEGHPLADGTEINSLLDPAVRTNGTKPQLRASLANFARAATRGLIRAEHVVTETVAQIQKLQAAGVNVTHVDCHKHAHMFPRIAEAV